MLLALMTDIHANREAFEACLAHAHARKVEKYAFLGDLVGYGADPAWVLDTVRDYVANGAFAVLGNHDLGVLRDERKQMNVTARYVLEWTRRQLNEEQKDFIADLPLKIEWEQLLFVHANAWAPDEWAYVDGVMEAARSINATTAQVTFCGHVHLPGLFHLNHLGRVGEFVPGSDLSMPLSRLRRWLVQPGSMGQPRDGNPAACYAIFDTVQHELIFFRVPYDTETAAQKVLAAGLPSSLAQRLILGG